MCATFFFKESDQNTLSSVQQPSIHDVSRLEEVVVSEIRHAKSVEELKSIVLRAGQENLKISIAGARHSQGGHIFYADAVVIDMTSFNKMLKLDKDRKVLTVQSGATWEQIQNYINPHGLAVMVMQASNIFTLGGSMSVNAHGRDHKYGSIVETISSFRLLKADGEIVNVSRTENSELFNLVIGGYGLFGIILDVDIRLTENLVYKKKTKYIDYKDYPAYFAKNIKGNSDLGLHFAWPSIKRSELLEKVLIADYHPTTSYSKKVFKLQEEEGIRRNKYFLNLSRKSDQGKAIRWSLQRRLIGLHGSLLSRNNAMRPEVKFLEYDSPKDTDILQEYFFPIKSYQAFMTGMRDILIRYDVNLLSATLRYVPAASEPFLKYASSEDSFAAVLYINQGLDDDAKALAAKWTRELVDLALSLDGNYYLAYQLYPTKDQIRSAYPMLNEFFRKKRAYDPNELFMNKFYEYYK